MVLAFSNLVSPASYTHPTRDYVTGRWTDALAAGCIVVGVAPRAASQTLGDGATLEISPTMRDEAWPVLTAAARTWTPEAAAAQQERARRALDWRWRLRDLCRAMEWPVPTLVEDELDRLMPTR